MQQQKFEDDAGEMEITEDYVVLDDATTGGNLDLSNLRKRKIKIISSAKETIENGEFFFFFYLASLWCLSLRELAPLLRVMNLPTN